VHVFALPVDITRSLVCLHEDIRRNIAIFVTLYSMLSSTSFLLMVHK
jgi:hypothetical protein